MQESSTAVLRTYQVELRAGLGVLFIVIGGMLTLSLVMAIVGIPLVKLGLAWIKPIKRFEGCCPGCDSFVKAAVVEGKPSTCTCSGCKARLIVRSCRFQIVE